MPLASMKVQNNSGGTAGSLVTNSFYDAVTDASGNFKFVDVSGDLAISTADVPTGSNAVVIHHAQVDSKFAQYTFDFMVTVLPSTSMEICQVRTGTIASSTKRTNWLLANNSGAPQITLRAGGDATVFTANLALNVWYTARLRFDSGSTASDGRTSGSITRRSDQVSINSGEKTDADNGAGANVAVVQTGKVPSTGTVGLVLDNFAFWDSAYTFLDPAPAPPVLAVTSGGPYWMHDGRGVSGGAYTLTHLSGPNNAASALEPIEGLFLVPQGTSESTYSLQVTTAAGLDAETVTVPPESTGGPVPGTVRRRVWNGSALL